MRAIRWFALILWVGSASYLWFRISPLAPDAVIRSVSTNPLIAISSNGTLATCRTVEDEDENATRTGPISWYDRRTGGLIRTVFSKQRCEIEEDEFLADRPPVARVIVDDDQVVADLWTGRTLARLPSWVDERPWQISPDGRYLAWMDPDNVQVIETATGKLVLKRPALKLLGFHGNEILGIRVRDADPADDHSHSIALWLPDGTLAETASPISQITTCLSPRGDLLIKRVDEFQAAVCDARTGAVIWQTQIPFPGPPAFIRWDMFRFNAAGDELLAVYGDEQERPRFARWRATDGQVISPLPTKLGPPNIGHGVDVDVATGLMKTSTFIMSPYDNYEGLVASSDGRYVVQPIESWSPLTETIVTKLQELEASFDVLDRLQLSSLFSSSEEYPPQAVFDATTGQRIGTVGAGNAAAPSDASWFAVQDQNSVRVYSAPFRADWTSLVMWALVPPLGLAAVTQLSRRAARIRRRDG